MSLYATPSRLFVRQVLTDVGFVAWTIAWWFVGRFVDGTVRLLVGPAQGISDTATTMQRTFESAARSVGEVPGIGPTIRQPFDAAGSGLGSIASSAQQQMAAIGQTATLLGLLIFLIPVIVLGVRWLPDRIRFVRDSREMGRFLDTDQLVDLMALRALCTQSPRELATVTATPAAAWRTGDRDVIARLARLEYARLGLRPPGPRTRATQPVEPDTIEPDDA